MEFTTMRPTSTHLLALAIITVALLAFPKPATAQVPGRTIAVVRLVDGSELLGEVVSETQDEVVVRTLAGPVLTVKRDQIRSLTVSRGAVVDGEFWREDGLGSKLFLGPTGRALKKGDWYFAVNELFLPAMQVGITDRLSFGVGKPFYFLTPATYITPKFQVYQDDRVAVSTGFLHLFIPEVGVGGVAYSVATIGSRAGAVTAGGGWIYGRDDDGGETEGAPVIMIGGDRRLTRKTSLVTDNYIFGGGAIVSVGARRVGRVMSFETGGMLFVHKEGIAGPPAIFFNFIFHPAR